MKTTNNGLEIWTSQNLCKQLYIQFGYLCYDLTSSLVPAVTIHWTELLDWNTRLHGLLDHVILSFYEHLTCFYSNLQRFSWSI